MESSDKEDIDSLFKKLNETEKKIKDIQESCLHGEYKVELFNFGLVRVCVKCYKKIGYPDSNDLEESGYI